MHILYICRHNILQPDVVSETARTLSQNCQIYEIWHLPFSRYLLSATGEKMYTNTTLISAI